MISMNKELILICLKFVIVNFSKVLDYVTKPLTGEHIFSVMEWWTSFRECQTQMGFPQMEGITSWLSQGIWLIAASLKIAWVGQKLQGNRKLSPIACCRVDTTNANIPSSSFGVLYYAEGRVATFKVYGSYCV